MFELLKLDRTSVPLTIDVLEMVKKRQDWKQLDVVIEELPEFLKVKPEILLKLGEVFISKGDFEQAVEYAKSLQEHTESHPISTHYLILSYFLQGDFKKVLSVPSNDGLLSGTKILIARALHFEKDLSKAIEIITGIENLEFNSEAIGLLSLLHFDAGNFSESVKLNSAALVINPHQFEALLAKACYEVVSRSIDQAAVTLEQCLQQQPDNDRVLSLKELILAIFSAVRAGS